ncbi:hypothetical protein GCM10022238_14910 [Gordonia hankookensis]
MFKSLERVSVPSDSTPKPDGSADPKSPIYLDRKSLTFAGVTGACLVIAPFLDCVTSMSDLWLAFSITVPVSILLTLIGLTVDFGPRLTANYLLSSVLIAAINWSLLLISAYGAIALTP